MRQKDCSTAHFCRCLWEIVPAIYHCLLLSNLRTQIKNISTKMKERDREREREGERMAGIQVTLEIGRQNAAGINQST